MRFLKNSSVHTIGLLAVMLFLSACVSTTTGPNVDKQRALETHIQLARAYIESNNRESARHHLRRAFDIDRNAPGALSAMAMLYQLEGEMDLAETYFKRALRRDRNDARTRNNYGVFLYNQERYREAFTEFEHAAADLEYDNRAQALVNLGRSALKLGNTDRAEGAFKHANVLDRRLPSALIELADMNFQKEQYADAKRYLDQYAGIAQQTARSLWLGIRIEQIFGNKDREASYTLALRNLFPYSQEYLEYLQIQQSR